MERRTFSRIGIGMTLMCAATYLVSSLLAGLLIAFGVYDYGTLLLIIQVSYYLVGLALMKLVLIGIPRDPLPRRTRLRGTDMLQFMLMGFGLLVLGAVLGNLSSLAVAELIDGSAVNPIDDMLSDVPVWVTAVLTLVLAPIFEEVIFRRLTLDVLRPFGDRTAAVVSGVLFGLFHMNISQFFYAALLGFVLSYLMLRTNNLWYPILLHFFINLVGSLLVPAIGDWIGYDNEMGQLIFNCIYYFLGIAGIALFAARLRQFVFDPPHYRFSRPISLGVQYGNLGMLALWILFFAQSIITLQPSWLPDFLLS